jgi:tripartite-type tricarboxylate transporter receptor subunit TctC
MRRAFAVLMPTMAILFLALGWSLAVAAGPTDFPVKGKSITLIVPYTAGGNTDIGARVLAAALEKEIGISVQVLNKPGASGQIGFTELARAKPDGYTLGYTILPPVITSYLDPSRQAIYTKRNFQPVAIQWIIPCVVFVEANSPYKTLKDLIDAARANPEKIKGGTTGLQSFPHIANIRLQKEANMKFAVVHFDGGVPEMTALLGGHIDVAFNGLPEVLAGFKGGKVRALGVMDKQESKYLPGVKTVESLGYKIYSYAVGTICLPAGTPKVIVDYLSDAIKRAMGTEDHMKKMDEFGFDVRTINPDQIDAMWAGIEAETKEVMHLFR